METGQLISFAGFAIIFVIIFTKIRNSICRVDPDNCDLSKRTFMGNLKYLKCKHCDNGIMTSRRIARHSQGTALFLILVGIFLCLTMAFAIIGIPMLISLIFAIGTKFCWVCQDCGSKIEKT